MKHGDIVDFAIDELQICRSIKIENNAISSRYPKNHKAKLNFYIDTEDDYYLQLLRVCFLEMSWIQWLMESTRK